MGKRLLLIMNPRAGQMKAKPYLIDIIALFSDYGYGSAVFLTKSAGDGIPLCRSRVGDADLIVAVGGDGTLNEVITGMMEAKRKKPIGYIPAGSTNVFSGNLNLSKDIMDAAKNIMEGVPKPLDIGKFNDRYFAFIASFGAFTKASYATPQSAKNNLGHFAYILEGIKEVPTIKPIHLRVETDDHVFEDDYVFGSFSNSLTLAGLVKLNANDVKLNDGLLEIMLIRYPKTADEVTQTIACLNSGQYDPDYISFCSSKKATVRGPAEVNWSLDGEFAKGSQLIRIQALHDAIDFVMKTP